jgi:hypothetical protein
MKRHKLINQLFLTIALLCVAALSQAQDDQESRFRFGLKGSLNINWFKANTKNIENGGVKMGYSYGVMGDYNLTKNYAFSSEFLITDIRANLKLANPMKESTDINGDSTFNTFSAASIDYKIKYVQIPLSIKFKTKEIGLITYWAQFGFAPCFLARAKADYLGVTPEDEYAKLAVNDKDNDKYHLVDSKDNALFNDKVFFIRIPLIIGAGIEYNLAGNTSLYAGLRMDNGFANTFTKDDKTKANLNYVSINAGIFF